MKKLKQWLRTKLRHFLGVDELDRQLMGQFINWRQDDARKFAVTQAILQEMDQRLKSQKLLIEHTRDLIHIGIDVHPHGMHKNNQAWCVIVVKGPDGQGKDLVDSFQFTYENYESLKQILKQFKGIPVALDLPPHHVGYFKDIRDWI